MEKRLSNNAVCRGVNWANSNGTLDIFRITPDNQQTIMERTDTDTWGSVTVRKNVHLSYAATAVSVTGLDQTGAVKSRHYTNQPSMKFEISSKPSQTDTCPSPDWNVSPTKSSQVENVPSSTSAGWSRRSFLRSTLGSAAGLVALPALSTRASAQGTTFDLTFYQLGDTHYRAFDSTISNTGIQINPAIRANIQRMAALTPTTTMPVAGTVGTPVGVIHVGDILESGIEAPLTKAQTLAKQWELYAKDFGLLGNETDSLVKFPVYECYGNHDQDGYLKEVSDLISARAAQLPGITSQSGTFTYINAFGNISVTGVHYAWKWGPIHFIQGNIRSGNGMDRMPSSGSYGFIKNYLETSVGTSGEPVMVIVHYPPTAGADTGPAGSLEWPLADKQAFYDLLVQYNVIGIICGHTHAFSSFLWKGPDNTGQIELPVFVSDELFGVPSANPELNGFMNVYRITNDPADSTKGRLVMARRMMNDTWDERVGKVTTRSFSLGSSPPLPSLVVSLWQSVNLHSNVARGLTIADNTFVEPRQAGIRQVEVQFAEPITVTNLASAVTITGVTQSGAVSSLASLAITTSIVLMGNNTLVIKFSNGGNPVALPDAAKWRFTLNPAVISGTGGAVLTPSAATTRVITGLVGDVTGSGRVSGLDLNRISATTSFDPAVEACLRADIDGNGIVGSADITAAWANRSLRTDTLATPT